MWRWVAAGLWMTGSTTGAGQSPSFETLTAAQQAAVRRGEPVQILEPVKSSSWPRSVVFVFVRATPEECAAVMSDYELQATYIPRLKSVRIVGRPGVNLTDVEYVIDVPIFPDERSVSRQWVSAANGDYQVHWRTVVADSAHPGSRTVGVATMRPFVGDGGVDGTLIIHDQTVVPASMLAGVPLVRDKGVQVSVQSATNTVRQIEKERASEPALLARQLKRLREALAAPRDSSESVARPLSIDE